MIGRGSRRCAARLLCAAASAAIVSDAAFAQAVSPAAPQPPPDAAELDPNAPLAPLPELGIPWPDLKPGETAPPAAITTTVKGKKQTEAVGAATGNIRYTIEVNGLAAMGNAEELLQQFRAQSALEAERKEPANAAQIGRRANADADLLTQLLKREHRASTPQLRGLATRAGIA